MHSCSLIRLAIGHSQERLKNKHFLAMTNVVKALPRIEEYNNETTERKTHMDKQNKIGLNQLGANLYIEEPLDLTVGVDRSVKPTYPDWFKKLEHPELECSGPAKYNLQAEVYGWFHDDQKNGYTTGKIICKYLQESKAVSTCLNLQDGLAIQAKGIVVFRKLFVDKAVFLWGSVAQNRDGHLYVPYLYDYGVSVGLDWRWLGNYWYSLSPALRFS